MNQTQQSGPDVSDKASRAALSFAQNKKQLVDQTFVISRDPSAFCSAYSELVDTYFRERLAENLANRVVGAETDFALVAVGGYGRKELCLHSDIDILIVYPKKIPKNAGGLSKGLFFPLWDMRLDLGHGVRTISECISLAEEDYQVFTSLLDMRIIGGNSDVFDDLQHRLVKKSKKHFSKYLQWTVQSSLQQFEKFGDPSTRIEPHLKQGLGGLRDIHVIKWLQRVAFLAGKKRTTFEDQSSPQELRRIASFLLSIRNMLHFETGRKTDTLFLELQPVIAQKMGYVSPALGSEVESFLSQLHKRMTLAAVLRKQFLFLFESLYLKRKTLDTRCTGILDEEDGVGFATEQTPKWHDIRALLLCIARTGAPASRKALSKMTDFLQTSAHGLAYSPEPFFCILELFSQEYGMEAGKVILDTGLLHAIIPEFEPVEHYMQFDAYHVHPVGMHTLVALANVFQLARQKDTYREVYESINDKEALHIALLFHDIGKGTKNHAESGAEIGREVATSLGLGDERTETIAFLIRNHLLLFKESTRLDLSDENAVANCAATIGSLERLKMLFILSVADAMATGPKAWNPWAESLLRELFFKLESILSQGILSKEDSVQRLIQSKVEIRDLAKSLFAQEFLNRCLEQMSARYVLSVPVPSILRHLGLIREFEEAYNEERKRVPQGKGGIGLVTLEAQQTTKHGLFTLDLVSKYQPNMFATICGVLALFDINIYKAAVYNWRDGLMIYTITINVPMDDVYLDELWSRIRASIKAANKGKLDLSYRIQKKQQSPSTKSKAEILLSKPSVQLDNRSSEYFSLLEVVADDKLGRLYEIATYLHKQNIKIIRASIATQGDRIKDIFHVSRRDGMKLNHEEEQSTLLSGLIAHLS